MARTLQVVVRNKANMGKRFLNYVIDLAFATVVIFFIFFLFGFISFVITWASNGENTEEISTMSPLVNRLIFLFLYVMILFFTEKFSKGRSLGKWITGTKVVKRDGTDLTTEDLLKRNFSRAVPFDQLSFLGNVGWHDSWSDTRVVNLKNYEHELNSANDIESLGTKENF